MPDRNMLNRYDFNFLNLLALFRSYLLMLILFLFPNIVRSNVTAVFNSSNKSVQSSYDLMLILIWNMSNERFMFLEMIYFSIDLNPRP